MRLNVTAQPGIGDTLQAFVERRAAFALDKFRHRIQTVSVSLKDTNGPKGGIDKQCRVTVELIPSGTIGIEEVQADLASAIARSLDRAGHAVGRKLARLKDAKVRRPSMGTLPEPPASQGDDQ